MTVRCCSLRAFSYRVSLLVAFALLVEGQTTQPGTVQILPDFNRTHAGGDVVHLGDNPNDTRFIPPQPSGATFTRTFELTSAQLAGTGAISLLLDQYQADNEILTQRSFVTLNGGFVNYLTRNSFIQDLTGATTIPVITESFSVRTLLRVGTNTLVVQAGDVHNPGDTLDDFCVTNIRVTGLSGGIPDIDIRGLTRASPPSLDFGAVPLGEVKRLRLYVVNVGAADSRLDGALGTPMSVGSPPHTAFSISGVSSFSLAPNQRPPYSVEVRFQPTEARAYEDLTRGIL